MWLEQVAGAMSGSSGAVGVGGSVTAPERRGQKAWPVELTPDRPRTDARGTRVSVAELEP